MHEAHVVDVVVCTVLHEMLLEPLIDDAQLINCPMVGIHRMLERIDEVKTITRVDHVSRPQLDKAALQQSPDIRHTAPIEVYNESIDFLQELGFGIIIVEIHEERVRI